MAFIFIHWLIMKSIQFPNFPGDSKHHVVISEHCPIVWFGGILVKNGSLHSHLEKYIMIPVITFYIPVTNLLSTWINYWHLVCIYLVTSSIAPNFLPWAVIYNIIIKYILNIFLPSALWTLKVSGSCTLEYIGCYSPLAEFLIMK